MSTEIKKLHFVAVARAPISGLDVELGRIGKEYAVRREQEPLFLFSSLDPVEPLDKAANAISDYKARFGK